MAAVPVAFEVEGRKESPAVVFVNSLGADLSMWESQVAALRDDYRVIRYDTRGHGSSPVPAGPYSLAELGNDLISLLDRLEIERASLCGVSLGGATAMWVAIDAPQRVDRLAVCFSSAHFGPPESWRERAALVRAEGTAAVAEAVVDRWFTTAFAAAEPDLIGRMREMVAATPREGYAGCCEALAEVDLRAQLHRIAAKTLVLSGQQDPATPPAAGRLVADGIPDAEFVEIASAAHLGCVERAEIVNRLLRAHLAEPLANR